MKSIRNTALRACITCSLLAAFCSTTVHAGEENKAQQNSRTTQPSRDISDPEFKGLYCVGYAHLDTQWRWDFAKTIDDYILRTLDDNFERFEQYPDFVFSFTGSVRYEMMKEYYPERYEKLKQYIADGRWFVSGSSVDEGDVNVPSPESIIRQVLYGNLYFKREFDKESVDFMLPDCFGFPASMPSLWAHCGLLGFSTQKLTWRSAVGIPFPIGVWEGPDGNGVIAALDPGSYATAYKGRIDQADKWVDRVNRNGQMYGVWADYHYYGVGDMGGAPREKDVRNYTTCSKEQDRKMDILLVSSDQLYKDITPAMREKLPRYSGDMLLIEHSAGTLTSQSYMKRWNRKGEQLADAAERAATTCFLLDSRKTYPRKKLERAWVRLLANQMHDILPGTSIPHAYRYSWNDDLVAMNQFAHVLSDAVGNISWHLDTNTTGQPLVVFNPLTINRTDIVEATVRCCKRKHIRVYDPEGNEAPSQELRRNHEDVDIIFMAKVPANGFAVYDVREAMDPYKDDKGPRIEDKTLSNETYRVTLNDQGDIQQIVDMRLGKQLLEKPASLVFTYEKPRDYPAWNMDWADRQKPPVGKVDGKPLFRIVENGPVRVAMAVTRKARNSEFTQVVRLARDDPGQIVEVDAKIDWQSTECALKASFPLTIANPNATYNWGMGTIERGNNEPVKYEVPSHEWFDLTDEKGEYGVTILEDSKFGSDKPSDNELRLTLLYTPGVRKSFIDQHSQDWGIHDIRYALYGHEGDWRKAGSEWRGRRFNQPLRAFKVGKHDGSRGKVLQTIRCSTPQVDIRAIKMAEESKAIIIRVQELWGKPANDAQIIFPSLINKLNEVDGQERFIAEVISDNPTRMKKFTFDLKPYEIRTYAAELQSTGSGRGNINERQFKAQFKARSKQELPFNFDVVSLDSDRSDGDMDLAGRTYPGESFPEIIVENGIEFKLGSMKSGENQAVVCRGQTIELLCPSRFSQIHILAAATEDVDAIFHVGDKPHNLTIQNWTGFIGQWYDRVWDITFKDVDFQCNGKVKAILPAYVKRDPIAWFSTHRHDPNEGNQAYQFAYIYHYVLSDNEDYHETLTLPYDERIRIFAITVASDSQATPASPLYDDFKDAKPIKVRHQYDKPLEKIFKGLNPFADVKRFRTENLSAEAMPELVATDDVDASAGKNFAFRVYTGDKNKLPHSSSGLEGDKLVRLNDGEIAKNDDDTQRCIWFDCEGRFTLDLQKTRTIETINTFSWHKSDRAPQYFSLWGSKESKMPSAGFKQAQDSGWELIAVVDTRKAGEGGIHATTISGKDKPLGPYRHLLWICEDRGQGTFLTEIDIDFAEEEK